MEKLEVEVGADISKLKQNLNAARDDIKGFKERAKSDTAIELSIKVAKLKADLQTVKNSIKADLPREVQIELTAKSELLKRDITQAGRELTNFLRTGQKDVSVLGNLFSNLGNGLKNVFSGNITGAMENFKQSINGIGTAMATAFAGLYVIQKVIGFLGDAKDKATAFKLSLVQVKTVTSGTAAEYDNLTKSIMRISEETGIASTKIADSAFFVASAGVALNDIPPILEVISKASLATGADATTVFMGLSSVASIYGIELKDLTSVSDLFFKANADGKLTMEGLTGAIGTVAPIAKTAGVSLQELIAAFATMVGQTGNADEVATQLKGSITAIAAPTETAKEVARQYGIELGTTALEGKGYAAVIKDIYDKTDGNIEVIREIVPEVRALTAVTYLGAEGAAEYTKKLDGQRNSLGETEKAVKKATAEEVINIKKAEQVWENWKINVGASLISVESSLILFVSWLGKWGQLVGKIIGQVLLFFITGFAFLGELIGNFAAFFVKNFGKMASNLIIIASNMWTGIGHGVANMVSIIQGGIGVALKNIEDFLNSGITMYNDFAKKIGADSFVIKGKVDMGSSGLISGAKKDIMGRYSPDIMAGTEKLDTGFNFGMTKTAVAATQNGAAEIKKDFQELTTTINETTKSTKNNVGAGKDQETTTKKQVVTLDKLGEKLTDLKAKLGKTDIGTKEFKDLQKEIIATQEQVDKLNEGTSKPKKGSGASEAKKELDAQKKAIEYKANAEIRAINESTKSEKDKATQIVAINKKMKEDLELIDGNYAEVQARHADEFLKQEQKNTEELKKEKEKSYDDLTKSQEKNIKNVEKLAESYGELKKKLTEVGKKGVEDIEALNKEIERLQKNLADITEKGKNDLATRGIEAAKELADLRKKAQENGGWTEEDLQKSLDLQKEIELVNANTTSQERADALVQSQKSKAQLIIDEIKLNEEKAQQELDAALAKKKATEDQLALDKKAIQDKMDATALMIVTETKIMIEEDEKRRKLEAEYTEFFTGEIAKRTEAMKALKEAVAEAKIAIESAGINQANLQSAGNNTVATNIVQNMNIGSNVDMESNMRWLNNQIVTK